jgi:hypothetical protein
MIAAGADPGANCDLPLTLARSEVTAVSAADDGLPAPPDAMELVVTAMDVREALASLSVEHRRVIVEMYFHGRSLAETAEILVIPAESVRLGAYYGLRELRRMLSPEPSQSAAHSRPGHAPARSLRGVPQPGPAQPVTAAPAADPAGHDGTPGQRSGPAWRLVPARPPHDPHAAARREPDPPVLRGVRALLA